MQLFLWKLSQDENNSYDTYDSAVVVAPDRMSASMVHPARYSDDGTAIYRWDRSQDAWVDDHLDYLVVETGWCDPSNVTVICVGKAADHLKAGDVVCSSYNAG